MFSNPFTPLFGGRPDSFFGREGILRRFDRALVDKGSDDRALFITGSRGYGKTALLEQLSVRAKARGLKVIDVGPDNPIGGIMRHLVPFDESTKTVDPEVEVSVFGTGGKLRAGSSSKTVRYDRDDFEYLLLDTCERKDLRLFVTIDEIQKVSLDDVTLICEAFQMASRKGFDVMIAVAGLPYAHERIIQHDGCTFMRRAAHEMLGPLLSGEVRDAFASSFGGIEGLSLDDAALQELLAFSKGHPYIMQLQGYYLVDAANRSGAEGRLLLTKQDVERVMPKVTAAYYRRALEPLVSVMPASEVKYLRGMAQVLDGDRMARTGEVAKLLGKEQNQLSFVRESLLNNGIVVAPERGKLMFMIPYLAEYIVEYAPVMPESVASVVEWKI